MENHTEHNEAVKRLGELINGIHFAMLTTAESDGTLRSRPMVTQEVEFDGNLWFFTSLASPKVNQIRKDPYHVNVTFADPNKQKYVSMSGRAQIFRDRAKAEELWRDKYKAFFPEGLDDPTLALIRVVVEQAEYWDSPSNVAVRAYRFAKSRLSDQTYQEQAEERGEHQKLDLK